MIQDLVFTDIKTYPEVLKNFSDHSGFEESDGITFSLSEIYNLGFYFELLPNYDSFSMGRSSGLIAVHRQIPSLGKSHPKIQLFTAESIHLNDITIPVFSDNAFVHVLPNDDVIVVTDAGDVYRYSGSREVSHEKLPAVYEGCYIMYVKFTDTNFVCLLTDGNVLDVQDFKTTFVMQHFDDLSKPKSMTVIPHEKSTNDSTKVMLCKDGNLLVFDDRRFFEVKMKKNVIAVSASYSYEKVAVLLEDFTLIVCDQTLSNVFYEVKIDTNDMTEFLMMDWVGDIAPAIAFKDAVILGTNDEHSPVIFVDGNCVIFGDCDSVYIITQTQSYRIAHVEENISITLNKYIESNSSTLCKIFDNRLKEPFVEKISLVENISSAISDLIDTAEYVKDKDAQVFFVAAASFANSFSNRERGNIIGKVNERLRIMNALNEIGIPITSKQFTNLSTDDLFGRLCNRGKYSLAFNIAKFMKINTTKIADELVMNTVNSIEDDSRVITELPLDQIRPAFAAEYALKVHREQLAIMFSELETDKSLKSLLFAKMQQWHQALRDAADTCDSSCLVGVLKEALKSDKKEVVNDAISKCEAAVHLLMKMPSLTTKERLGEIIDKIPQNIPLTDVKNVYTLVTSGFTYTLDSCKSVGHLPEAKEKIIEKLGDPSIEKMSLNETIRHLIANDNDDELRVVVRKCSVDSKRVDALRFETYVKTKKWVALKNFGATRKMKDMWPTIIMIMKHEKDALARDFIDELESNGLIDSKAKEQIINNYESGTYDTNSVDSLKPISCVFNS